MFGVSYHIRAHVFVIGMRPVTLRWASGLAGPAGLGTVAMAGCLVSTLCTLVHVPLFYRSLNGVTIRIRRIAAREYPAVATDEAPNQVTS